MIHLPKPTRLDLGNQTPKSLKKATRQIDKVQSIIFQKKSMKISKGGSLISLLEFQPKSTRLWKTLKEATSMRLTNMNWNKRRSSAKKARKRKKRNQRKKRYKREKVYLEKRR